MTPRSQTAHPILADARAKQSYLDQGFNPRKIHAAGDVATSNGLRQMKIHLHPASRPEATIAKTKSKRKKNCGSEAPQSKRVTDQ
jgi:hypothetical protein